MAGRISHAEISSYGVVEASGVSTTYASVKTFGDDQAAMFIFNALSEAVVVSLDGGSTDHFLVPAGISISVDFQTFQLRAKKPEVQVKALDAIPTTGFLSVTGMRPEINV